MWYEYTELNITVVYALFASLSSVVLILLYMHVCYVLRAGINKN